VGSALALPEYPEKQYMKWAREYGELFQVQLGWNQWVFVNSEEAVKVPSPLPPDHLVCGLQLAVS